MKISNATDTVLKKPLAQDCRWRYILSGHEGACSPPNTICSTVVDRSLASTGKA